MNFDNLEVTLEFEQTGLGYSSWPAGHIARIPEFEQRWNDNAIDQIREYVKTFRALPTKEFWIGNNEGDPFRVLRTEINPLQNSLSCTIEW